MSKHSPGPMVDATDAAVPAAAVAVVLDHQVSAQVDDETVILHFEDGVYYGLDRVGTSIWRLLQEPRTVAEIRDRIVEEYDVDAERCERDLLTLLRDLVERGLIDMSEPEVRRP